MTRDFQQRWAHAYERAKDRRRRRVDTLIALVQGGPDATAWREAAIRRADVLVGQAVRFEDRVHAMLANPRYWSKA